MLPDSDFTNAQKTVMADKGFTCVPVSNEAIAFGVCAGAWLGGKKPALLITTDGIMASAFPLTTLNMQKNIPVLMVIPYRGSLGDGIWFMGTHGSDDRAHPERSSRSLYTGRVRMSGNRHPVDLIGADR